MIKEIVKTNKNCLQQSKNKFKSKEKSPIFDLLYGNNLTVHHHIYEHGSNLPISNLLPNKMNWHIPNSIETW